MRDLTPVLDVLAVAETALDADARMAPVAAVASDGAEIDVAAFARHVPAHPLIAHHLRTGDAGPLRLSDFVSGRGLRELGVYADFYAPLGVDRALCVALPPTAGRTIGIAFHRAGRDFA